MYGYICYRPLNISYQSLNVGFWPKIEGFCHLHAKLIVIFLKYVLSHNSVLRKLSIWGNVFSSIDVRTMHSFFLLAPYAFTCDVPNKYSILHTCIKK